MIQTIINFLLHTDAQLIAIAQNYGNFIYPVIFLIIFLETGLVITPFLPGDSLLFIAGTLAAANILNVYVLFFLLFIAAVFGDTLNYWLGHYFGEKLFHRFVNPKHIEKTQIFFQKYGKKTILLARFVPIVRTFAPFVAGIGKMNYGIFLSYNIIGGFLWTFIFIFSGYYFGNIPFIKNNLTAVVLCIIIISCLPAVIEYARHKTNNAK
jgi:membrane-associated protein